MKARATSTSLLPEGHLRGVMRKIGDACACKKFLRRAARTCGIGKIVFQAVIEGIRVVAIDQRCAQIRIDIPDLTVFCFKRREWLFRGLFLHPHPLWKLGKSGLTDNPHKARLRMGPFQSGHAHRRSADPCLPEDERCRSSRKSSVGRFARCDATTQSHTK